MKTNLDTKTSRIVDIAKDAGRSVMNIYENNLFNQRFKSDNNPLTEADIASHHVSIFGVVHAPAINETWAGVVVRKI